MSVNTLFIGSPYSGSPQPNSGVSTLTTPLGNLFNSIDSLALPIEKGIGNFSQIYTQIKQLNPQAQTSIPVNAAFYQAPQGSLAGNFAVGLGNAFQQIPWYTWAIIGVLGIGAVVVFAKNG